MPRTTIASEVCKGCGLCVEVCPKNIIELDNADLNSKGYPPAKVIDMEECVGCAACATMCPDSAITVEKE